MSNNIDTIILDIPDVSNTAINNTSQEEDVKQKNNTKKIVECLICLDAIENEDPVFTPCIHGFHDACINQWIKQKIYDRYIPCPICKTDIAELAGYRNPSDLYEPDEPINFNTLLNNPFQLPRSNQQIEEDQNVLRFNPSNFYPSSFNSPNFNSSSAHYDIKDQIHILPPLLIANDIFNNITNSLRSTNLYYRTIARPIDQVAIPPQPQQTVEPPQPNEVIMRNIFQLISERVNERVNEQDNHQS